MNTIATEQTEATKGVLGEEVYRELGIDPTPLVAQERVVVASCNNLYENTPLSGSKIEQDAKEMEGALYGYKTPNFGIQQEKPEHRVVVLLHLQRHNSEEISKRTGFTRHWVRQILRQPWAVKYMTEELQKQGRDTLHELLALSAEDSVYTLIDMRDNVKAKPAERIQAANSLLNRYLGNPTQPIAHSGKVNVDTMSDEELLKIATQTSPN